MDESRHRFELLRLRYAASLAHKHEALSQVWREFRAQPQEDALRRELQQQIHRLCGSAPAYGYERLGERARVADKLMRDWEMSTPSLRDTLDDLAVRLAEPLQSVLDDLQDAGAQASTPQGDGESRMRVLLVEDDPGQAMLTAARLESYGCVLRIEGSADGLWETLLMWPCHAIVLDYWLRGETADEVAAMLRREPRFERIALVCFTAERDPLVLRAAIDAGCDAALRKDEGVARLFDVLRDCVARTDRSGVRFA